eukprot:15244587-Alexandrium_andersonii.AAC.1
MRQIPHPGWRAEDHGPSGAARQELRRRRAHHPSRLHHRSRLHHLQLPLFLDRRARLMFIGGRPAVRRSSPLRPIRSRL